MSHFGLALQEYTHFTSPIRRYADVLVHRQLLQAIKSDPGQGLGSASSIDESANPGPLMSHAELANAAEIMNERHRASKRAQKACSDLYLLLLLHRYELQIVNHPCGHPQCRVKAVSDAVSLQAPGEQSCCRQPYQPSVSVQHDISIRRIYPTCMHSSFPFTRLPWSAHIAWYQVDLITAYSSQILVP